MCRQKKDDQMIFKNNINKDRFVIDIIAHILDDKS